MKDDDEDDESCCEADSSLGFVSSGNCGRWRVCSMATRSSRTWPLLFTVYNALSSPLPVIEELVKSSLKKESNANSRSALLNVQKSGGKASDCTRPVSLSIVV